MNIKLSVFVTTILSTCIFNLAQSMTAINQQLLFAASHGNVALVTSCLNNGANINATFPGTSSTPLIWATSAGHENVVAVLLQHPAIQINAVSSTGQTALDIAIERNFTTIIQLLLTHSALRGRDLEMRHILPKD